jgi:hypothetical protein
MGQQTVNVALIQGFIDKNGISELERLSGVSVHTIMRIKNRINPRVPKLSKTRVRLAEAIGVTEEKLFPVVGAKGKKKAS